MTAYSDPSTAELVDLDPLVGGLADLSYSLSKSIEECPSIYPNVVAGWGKVMNQFTTLLEISLPNIPLTPASIYSMDRPNGKICHHPRRGNRLPIGPTTSRIL